MRKKTTHPDASFELTIFFQVKNTLGRLLWAFSCMTRIQYHNKTSIDHNLQEEKNNLVACTEFYLLLKVAKF
jgi:hypothetical protein